MTRVRVLFFIVAWIAIVYLFQIITNKQAKSMYDCFYSSSLDGTIEQLRIKQHGVGLKLHNNNKLFVFYPLSRPGLTGNFLSFANKGDSIAKPPLSDTLYLVKDGKKYSFRFRKF